MKFFRVLKIASLFLISHLPEAVSVQPHHITAFVGNPKELYLLPSFSSYSTDHFWNKDYHKLPSHNRFRRQSYLLYAEFAINKSNSITFDGGYSNVCESLNGNSHAFDDVELGWKHVLACSRTSAFTAQLTAILPVGDKKYSIRYGRWGGQLDLLYSKVFEIFNKISWIDTGIGYRYYSGFPSDQLRAGFAMGCKMSPKISFIGSSQLDFSVRNGKSSFNRNNITFHPNYRLLRLQLECVFQVLSRVSISLGGYYHAWGQNTGTGGGGFCGTWIVY